MIRITNLKKQLSDGFCLDIPSLVIESGERVALVGVNGSGKSTLLRLIAGVLKPDSGTIEIDVPKEEICYQPQTPFCFNGTVRSNVALSCKDEALCDRLLRECRLTELSKQKVGALSGGERQRVALARSLAKQSAILLLDEPLSASDLEMGDALSEVIKHEYDSPDKTLLVATHLPKHAFLTATKILLLNAGRIEEYNDPQAMKTPDSTFGKAFFAQWVWG